MTSEIIKRMFDACYQAKRTRDMLPAAAGRCQSILYSVSGCDSVIGKKGHTGKSIGSQRCNGASKTGCYKNGQRNGRKRISFRRLLPKRMDVSHTLLLRKKAQNCHRNMTNNILTACFHIWKKYRTKMQNA